MPTPAQIIVGATAAAVVGIGAIGLAVNASDDGGTSATLAAEPAPVFQATFDTASDFYDRFDYGYSGLFNPALGSITTYHGDHDLACNGPTTSRTVTLAGPPNNMNFSEALWFCAPGNDPSKGHLMTGQTTGGYNHIWFSPKPTFIGITKVCWDVNATFLGGGKWTEVQFVGNADAARFPVGISTYGDSGFTRGSGGFDLGYTAPEFRDPNGPTTRILPEGGTLAGLKADIGNSIFQWWQDQSTVVANQVGWPGLLNTLVTDKATRYTSCLENVGTSQLQITNVQPDGLHTFVINGAHIPSDARRVVFHDSEYDGPKRPGANPNFLTWHWDNIQVFTADSPPVTTVVPPPTSTVPTTPPPTSVVSTTTTEPPTTTTEPTTTTTTVPGSSTTTTVDPCPASFTPEEHAWCESVEARFAP